MTEDAAPLGQKPGEVAQGRDGGLRENDELVIDETQIVDLLAETPEFPVDAP